MKVKEVKELLEQVPDDYDVYVEDWNNAWDPIKIDKEDITVDIKNERVIF